MVSPSATREMTGVLVDIPPTRTLQVREGLFVCCCCVSSIIYVISPPADNMSAVKTWLPE